MQLALQSQYLFMLILSELVKSLMKKIEDIISRHFDLTPKGIIKHLDLLRPVYKKTASYGHFGREDSDFYLGKIGQSRRA